MKTISLVLKALVEKLEQEINNDIDMNVETEQFISTDTYSPIAQIRKVALTETGF